MDFSTQMIFATRKTEGAKHFRRLYDKKVNVLGMAAVLTVPDESLPAEVAAGLPQLMAGLIKLLTSLKQQQARSLNTLWWLCLLLPEACLMERAFWQDTVTAPSGFLVSFEIPSRDCCLEGDLSELQLSFWSLIRRAQKRKPFLNLHASNCPGFGIDLLHDPKIHPAEQCSFQSLWQSKKASAFRTRSGLQMLSCNSDRPPFAMIHAAKFTALDVAIVHLQGIISAVSWRGLVHTVWV